MKKKIILILLSIGLIVAISFFVMFLLQATGSFRAYNLYLNTYEESKSSNSTYWYDFSGKAITATEWIRLTTIRYLIKPILLLIGSFSLILILLYMIIVAAKRMKLILTERDEQILKEQELQQKISKKEKKRQQRIMQLNAKIEKLKNKDDK